LEASYELGEPVGEWRYYYEHGSIRTRQYYAEGRRQGIWEFYRPDGRLDFTIDYRQTDVNWADEMQAGIYVYFDENGDTSRVEKWLGGQRTQ
jgi:antitoxin component YwqK of YwqJK toxin-antitoxin module